MKKPLLLFIFLSFTVFNSQGQNLVLNGDFEQYSGCPDTYSQLDSALFWFNPALYPPVGWGGTPDYFNQCSTTTVSVPANFPGYQVAHSGIAYGGIIIFTQSPYALEQREYMEGTFTSPLAANSCYHFEMYVSCADDCQYEVSDLAVYFSNTAVTGVNNFNPLPFTPQINNSTGIITDTLNWVLISGNYTASGGENYFIIGNFNSDAFTTFQQVNPFATYQFAYYYIDDVSLNPCTGIEEQNQNEAIKIYPNPVREELKIKNAGLEIKEIKIYDATGRIVMEQTNLKSKVINLKSFHNGIYFIEINDGKNIYRKKFLKE